MVTTRKQMRNLREGDKFYAYDREHMAATDAGHFGVKGVDKFVYYVFDDDGKSWFEWEFPEYEGGHVLSDKERSETDFADLIRIYGHESDGMGDMGEGDVFYRDEFPDFDKELYIPEGFRDCSWHNDEMPRVVMEDGNFCYSIWQNYENPELRVGDFDYLFEIEHEGTGVIYSLPANDLAVIQVLIKGIVE